MASSLFPDNGLASLAGTLLAMGHEVKVLDYNTVGVLRRLVPPERTTALAALLPFLGAKPGPDVVEHLLEINRALEEDLARVTEELAEDIAREVEEQDSHFLGFKLWSGDGFLASIRIAERLHSLFPGLKLYGGGPAVLYSEHTLFAHSNVFDALVDGEGEQAILGLAAFAEGKGSLGQVPNLVLSNGEKFQRTARSLVSDLDGLALPAYSPAVYPSLSGDEKIKLFVLDESRGCPMGCAFCIHQDASGNRWRIKSPERVLQEVSVLGKDFGTSSIRLGGSYTPARFFEDFARILGQTGVDIRFCGFAHPEGLPMEELNSLAASGCRSLFLGVESFDESDLRRLGKRMNPERARESVRACLDAGIVPVVSVIMPVPGQTPEGLKTNREALLELCSGTRATVVTQFPVLMPRTRWWEDKHANGFRLLVEEDDYRQMTATYQVRHIIPPAFWEPLPYTVDGMGFKEYAGANARFQRMLAEEGIVINVPDEVVLIADMLEMSLLDIRTRLQGLCFTLDAEAMASFVADLNSRLTSA